MTWLYLVQYGALGVLVMLLVMGKLVPSYVYARRELADFEHESAAVQTQLRRAAGVLERAQGDMREAKRALGWDVPEEELPAGPGAWAAERALCLQQAELELEEIVRAAGLRYEDFMPDPEDDPCAGLATERILW